MASIAVALILKDDIYAFVTRTYVDFNSNVIVSTIPSSVIISPLTSAISVVIALMAVPIVIIFLLHFKSRASIIGALFASIIMVLALYILYVYATAIMFEYEYAQQLPVFEPGIVAFFGTVSMGVLYIFLERKSANKSLQPTAGSGG